MQELAACIERHIAARSPSTTVAPSPSALIRHFVDTHFAEHLTLDRVADAIGCARSRVAATFKRHLGEAMPRYVARVRIRRAAELIVQGDKIEAAMLAVGYRSKKNFYHQFKRETGETPATYRGGFRSPDAGGSPKVVTSPTLDLIGAVGSDTTGGGAQDTRGAWPGPPGNQLPDTRDEPSETAVTIARASKLLGVSRRTVYNWIRQGRLETTRQPNGARRIPLDSVCGAAPNVAVGGRAVWRQPK